MISIQSIMLVALGFLSAVLLGLLIAPAVWRRAVRLTTRRLKEQLPLSDAEIRADKDRLRAEYAIRVHKLEMKVEQSNLQRARDTIEINRRDGTISQLEQERGRLNAAVEENQNARLVLEQTVADRLPKVEHRLNEARQILFSRDREIAELSQSTTRQNMALEEAYSINKQQTSELDRLTTALTVRGARNQDSLSDPNYDGEIALRSEIEALRAKAREQAGLIGRLQSQQAQQMGVLAPLGEAGPAPVGLRPIQRNSANGGGNGSNGQISPIEPRQTDSRPVDPRLADRQAGNALALVSMMPDDVRLAAEREIRSLRARVDDQGSEIARLSSELQTFQNNDQGAGLKDSKIALKARLNAAQSQTEQNTETIKRLRAELAAANERLALQGAHFMEQMRRLGAGTLPANGQTRRPVTQNQKLTLSERVAQSRPQLMPVTTSVQTPQPASAPALTPGSVPGSTLAQPDTEPSASPSPKGVPTSVAPAAPVVTPLSTPASQSIPDAHLKPDMGVPLSEQPVEVLAPVKPIEIASNVVAMAPADVSLTPAAHGARNGTQTESLIATTPPIALEAKPRKPRLIDRISSINKV